MSEAENKILEQIYAYSFRRSPYERLLKIFENQDENPIILSHLIEKIGSPLRCFYGYYGVTEEEINAFRRKHEILAIECYQKALDYNYELLRRYKETGVEPEYFDCLVMTVDKDGNPKKTRVVDVVEGKPVFEDGCEIKAIDRVMVNIDSLIGDLHQWLHREGSLEEKLDKALKLKKQGPLGEQSPPTPNYDIDHLVGGQRDAAAWENYAIEMGMVRTVNYDYALEKLIKCLEKSIEFFKQATSIV